MRGAAILASWVFTGACIFTACGGASDTDLFGAAGDAGSSGTSGTSGTSSTSGASGSSGTTSTSSSTSSSSSTSGAPDGSAGGCNSNADCNNTQYCLFPVGANGCAKVGKCVAKPTNVTSTQQAAVCGCDGVTYWNAQLAAFRGVTVLAPEACAVASAGTELCGGNTKCPNDTRCAMARGSIGQCQNNQIPGTCWALPDTCPDANGGKFRQCGTVTCTNLCQAIKAEKPFYQDGTCL